MNVIKIVLTPWVNVKKINLCDIEFPIYENCVVTI